jgi:hypothetical protein
VEVKNMKLVVFLLITTICIGFGQAMDAERELKISVNQAMDAKRELKISVNRELPQGARRPVFGCGGNEIKGAEMEKALESLIKSR